MTSKRNISALNEGALNARVVRPIMFLRLDFFTGVQRYHTEIGPRDAVHPIFGNETYVGIGDFGGISSNITESISQAPQAIKFSLTGVKSSFISDAFTDDYHRRDIDAMFGFDDENGDLIDDPVIVWSGYMDKVDITLGDQTGEMTLTCESRATVGQQSSDLRFSDEDLQAAVTGDLAGEYIFRMGDLQLTWGGDHIQSGLGGTGGAFYSPNTAGGGQRHR
jgi:hypothetical protein